jgi:TRAP-type C4-dicarboxylate transport system substrate-binding protein
MLCGKEILRRILILNKKNLLKVIISISLVTIMLVSISLIGGCASQTTTPTTPKPAAEQSTFTLRVQVGFGPPETDGLIRPIFQKMEAASGGRLNFEVYCVGEIVPDDQCVEACMEGTLDIIFGTGAHAATPLDIAELDSSPPFAWNSAMELTTLWYERGLKEIWTQAYEEMGKIKLVGYAPTDPTHIITKSPINHLADLKGLKLDAMPNIAGILEEEADCTCVGLPREELYLSGKTGVIDGLADMGATEAHANSFNEVFPYFLDNPLGGAWLCWWIMNEDSWNSLPADLQNLIEMGFKAATLDFHLFYYEGEASNRKAFTVTHMPAEEFNVFRENALARWDDFAKTSPRMAQVVQIIRDYNNEVETTKWWR